MDKLMLTLSLLAFSSGVLCNVAQNLADGGPAADSVMPRTEVLRGHKQWSHSTKDKYCTHHVPHDYVFLRDKEAYKLHMANVTWNEARTICMDEGGLLAIINSDVDAAKLVHWMKNKGVHDVWIAAHDMFEQGHWVTLIGEPLARAGYNRWLLGEPNNEGGNEHCGTLGDENGMSDLACDLTRPYFCKMLKC